MRPVSRPVTSISVASRNGLIKCGLPAITRPPMGTRSIAPHNVHQRPLQSRTRRFGAPRVLKARRMCMAPLAQNAAQPSTLLVRMVMLTSQAGMTQVLEM